MVFIGFSWFGGRFRVQPAPNMIAVLNCFLFLRSFTGDLVLSLFTHVLVFLLEINMAGF